MPQKTRTDENANARRTTNSRSKALASDSNNRATKKKKISLGNSRHANGRVFAREIKNIVGGHRQDTMEDAQFRFDGPSLLNQLVTTFEKFDLRDVGATSGTTTMPEADPLAKSSEPFLPSTLFSSQAFSTGSLATCSKCKRKWAMSSGYDSDAGFQTRPKTASCVCREYRYSTDTTNVMKRSSFRSASIVSQSTPLIAKTVRRPIRPFHPLEDDSIYHGCLSACSTPERLRTAEDVSDARDGLHDNIDSQATDERYDEDIMTQLASQLSEVVLSPCIVPVSDELPETLQDSSTSRSCCTSPPTRLKGRAASFSLGFIPTAFSGDVDIKDLRIV